MRKQGILGQPWSKCGRCDALFPIGRLTAQKGLKLCSRCLDDLTIEKRPQIIADVLSQGEELKDYTSEPLENTSGGELEF